ncbi:hypothetical protein UFOVP17_14 [uncultured Caudovirales phage]|uniref:Uncharacterized protein n=1 Tax=uncultured Caudovirales phage TaxID=2100421 RepID=A0A6J5KNR7_9CAUD|nr:hypothetical protein UFOVP17_14 [uncultured Caudovirales phage]
MIKFLIFKRYNFIDFVGQGMAIWLMMKFDTYWGLAIILPFSFLSALCESIDRMRNDF